MAPSLVYTPLEEIPKIRDHLRAGFKSGKTKSIAYRKEQLLGLAYLIKDNTTALEDAIREDMGRHALETAVADIGGMIVEAKVAYDNVEKWAKTERAPFNFNYAAMRPSIRKEPKGVVCIIGPFNIPVWLLLGPLAGAIAAGNACVLKPSEMAPATAALITELLPRYLDPELYGVVNGGVAETTRLLELQWDHILYTGNGKVGRIVSIAAAKHLTPVTLELGGKNPVVIDPKCDLAVAAKRILWGKAANAGQLCVCPDYVLIQPEVQDKFIAALKEAHDTFYPEGPAKSESMGRIINATHFKRVKTLLDNTKGTIAFGGETDEATRYIAPTVVTNVTGDDSLMSEEIFGPVLAVISVKDVDEAIEFINARDHPLAVYVFSQDAAFKSKVFDNTQSGSALANDVVIHPVIDGLPLGGVGPSGSGMHTGKYSFDTFTHLRATIDSPKFVDIVMNARYPPYTVRRPRCRCSG
ncbi:hypothetical protein PLICRDRAFT_112150 [Plicaturopsis crispa FD-325 SS-3]|nr:hypothetical protein PLICRDRAFT_112150 [Plicaturopsis crispa FD-325 SS-3]